MTEMEEIEKAFGACRIIHEKGMDPKMIELDRKGNWLHLTWFAAGYKAAMAESRTEEQYQDLSDRLIKGMKDRELLESKNTALMEIVERLKKDMGFYADKGNWLPNLGGKFRVITEDDYDFIKSISGKLARTTLAWVDEKMKVLK